MYKTVVLLLSVLFLSCKTTTYYIVRHAEKEPVTTMTSDVPLSAAGEQRAEALKDMLEKENISHIFSTNFLRTRSTAQPLADATGVPIETYDPNDPDFIEKLKSLEGNVLIVGHSNTVDDLVNKLAGKKEIDGDLPESEYGDLFIVKKTGNRSGFDRKHFGK